jgi:hypothetical protein
VDPREGHNGEGQPHGPVTFYTGGVRWVPGMPGPTWEFLRDPELAWQLVR